MPDVSNLIMKMRLNYIERSFGVYILRIYYDENGPLIFMAYAVCSGQRAFRPFGMMVVALDRNSAVLYLDNKPTDGIVDEKIENPHDREILRDLPTCV
jgi:hypothetical protein